MFFCWAICSSFSVIVLALIMSNSLSLNLFVPSLIQKMLKTCFCTEDAKISLTSKGRSNYFFLAYILETCFFMVINSTLKNGKTKY